ncbi:hypothetical protein SARC_11009 [Sphaeroforma arctica JP610]|uniref:Arrestin-like N-terminal domain-containing protein n=1 Tax=Sphaeroforma arctica JP610 TaxID=667725 RepID=A0A0L0FI79_9EUKA|nr:hypothetical protein SARC_11009 [Sphaeroforma arctica JP610]KNC76492.1 hypothetical protein SARC_11009 [Sphaeroforma arctica JP610]|eukprot:XP_014150394.1 hypothetical protein SARC_11009 [Sphaeroforma arctica JP610]
MGNNNSVRIQTDRVCYTGGQVVSGSVSVVITQPVKCEALHLTVKGSERTEYEKERTRETTDMNGNRRTESYYETIYDKHTIFKQKVMMHQFDDSVYLQPGQYSFPIQTLLPHGLPPSCRDKIGQSRANRTYKVKCHLYVPGWSKSDLRHQQEFMVREAPTRPRLGNVMQEDNHRVKRWLFKDCGRVFMKVTCMDTYDLIGNEGTQNEGRGVNLLIEVDNSHCKSKIREVKVNLKHDLLISGTNRGNTREARTSTGVKIPAGEKFMKNISFPFPEHLCSTSRGYIFDVLYHINVVLIIPNASDYKTSLPVTLTDSRAQTQQLLSAPYAPLASEIAAVQWQPQYMPAFVSNTPPAFVPPPTYESVAYQAPAKNEKDTMPNAPPSEVAGASAPAYALSAYTDMYAMTPENPSLYPPVVSEKQVMGKV